jgi:diacylglycerol kinase family enzyme
MFRGRRVFQKSHPNDAKIEVLTIDRKMRLRQRLLAVMRVRKGSHLPHPHLTIWQTTTEDMHFHRPLPVFVDGVKVAMADTLRISVIPDAINIYIPSDHK